MAISLVAIGAKITAYLANLLIGAVNAQQGTVVVPTSATGTGVTLSTSGQVAFSGASTINVNGCFTSTYDMYRIDFYAPTTSTSLNLTLVLRAAGTNSTTGYDQQSAQANNATMTVAQVLNGSSWSIVAASTTGHRSTIELVYPAQAAATHGEVRALSTPNPMTTSAAIVQRGILHRATTAYDGFQIATSTGTVTGWLVITGMNRGA